jgi:hypothetical protein
MGIYKFGNNTYHRRIRRRSNLGHIFREKECVLWAGKYGNDIDCAPSSMEKYTDFPSNTTINLIATQLHVFWPTAEKSPGWQIKTF